MEFSLPLWPIIKKPLEWLAKELFLSAYQASDEFYWRHHGIGSSWRELGENIEYDTHLATIFSNDNPPLSYISVKAKNGNHFKKLTLKFAVKGQFVNCQDTIVIYDLSEAPVIKSLPSIPLKTLWVAGDGFSVPYNEVHLEIVELLNSKGINLLEGKKVEDSFTPTYMELLKSEFVKRWGRYWNVDEINWHKREIKDYLCMKLLLSDDRPWPPVNFWHPRRLLFLMLANKYSLAVVFWSRNLVHGKQIRSAIKKEW